MSEKTFIGYTPHSWQKVVHQAIELAGPKAGKMFVVKSPRQIGKSLLCEMELLRHAINYKGSVNYCVSITFAQCKKIFLELWKGIRDSGIVAHCDKQSMELEFTNGSVIKFKSAQQRESLRGETCKNNGIVIIDEAAYISQDIIEIILPWTNVHHSNILMTSTPKMKAGPFYEWYTAGLDPSNTLVESFDLSKFDTTEMLSLEKVELYRHQMSKNKFVTEILGEFSDSGAGVFDLSKDIWRKDDTMTWSDLFIGIDWGSGSSGDYTVISGFTPDATQQMLEMTNDKTPTEQIAWLSSIIRQVQPNKVKKILCEKNSIGAVYFDMLKRELPNYPIYDFITSNSSKREIIEYMIQRIENENIKLINNKEQYVQFGAYQEEITSSGQITYNSEAPMHDDCVMASAIALKSIKDLETNGNYTVSFARPQNHKHKLRENYGF